MISANECTQGVWQPTLCREPIRFVSVELIGASVPLFMMNVDSLPEIPILRGEGRRSVSIGEVRRGILYHDGEHALELSNELAELCSASTDGGDVVERHEAVHAHADIVFCLSRFLTVRAWYDGHCVVRRRRE